MNEWLIAVTIGAAFGFALGVKIARDSHRKQPVLGGMLAQAFHYLACVGMTSMLPFIITGIVVGLPFWLLFGTALGCLALTAAFLLLDAAIERGAPAPADTKPVLTD